MVFERLANLFRPRTALELAAAELAEAERSRLAAQSAQEYAASMVAYHATRIERLRTILQMEAGNAA